MNTSYLDALPAEAQPMIGAVAGVLLVVSLILWAFGIKIARIGTTLLLGFTCAAGAAWLAPQGPIDIAPITAAIIGFVIGALIGALLFRLVQGATLAACLGIAVAALYFHWHVQPAAATQAATGPATTQAVIDLIAVQRFDIAAVPPLVDGLSRQLHDAPAKHQLRMAAAGIGTAVAVLLVAFFFMNATTIVVTAALGAMGLLASVHALLHVAGPPYRDYFPHDPVLRYFLLAFVTVLGVLIQYRISREKADNQPLKRSEQNADSPSAS